MRVKFIFHAAILLSFAAVPGIGFSQMSHGAMGDMTMASDKAMTEGEVKKVDRDQAKLTIKHGEIQNLDMPGMTMVFSVRDRTYLDKVKVGDKIKFSVVMENGRMIVTEIQPAK